MNPIDVLSPIRLFQLNGHVPFLFADRFAHGYKDLQGIVSDNGELWISYMPDEVRKQTLEEGFSIYSSIESYRKIKNDQKNLYNKTLECRDKIVNGDFTKEDIDYFFEITIKFGINYRFTEFFYTDLAFEKRNDNPIILENFKTFEDFKLEGRNMLNEIFLLPNSIYVIVLSGVAKKFSVPLEDLIEYSMTEVLSLFDNIKVNLEILNKRRCGYVMFFSDLKPQYIIGNEALVLIQELYNKTHSTTEIKGQIACKGVVRGVAKVIKVNIQEFGKLSEVVESMQKGQILVAETTDPSIIQACYKASAIVTNQGGMMSHAAIVARELNIPCVVGTGTATEIIKDGDTVEVDANKGIIRIIN